MENQEVKNAKTLLQLLVKLSTSGVVQAPSKFVEKRLRVCAWANLPAMQHSKYIVSTWCLSYIVSCSSSSPNVVCLLFVYQVEN